MRLQDLLIINISSRNVQIYLILLLKYSPRKGSISGYYFWLCGSRHAQPRPNLPRFAKDLIWQSWWHCEIEIKVALSPSKKVDFICFNDSLSKIMKNAFYFTLNIHLFTYFLFKLFIFCLTFLMMQENGLIRKLGIISKFMRSNV